VLGVDLPTEGEFETVAGLINAELGRIGDVGDSVVVDDVALDVERVDGHRIRRVRVRPLTDADDGSDGIGNGGEGEDDHGGTAGHDGTDDEARDTDAADR
jgi:hypothetical protein